MTVFVVFDVEDDELSDDMAEEDVAIGLGMGLLFLRVRGGGGGGGGGVDMVMKLEAKSRCVRRRTKMIGYFLCVTRTDDDDDDWPVF